MTSSRSSKREPGMGELNALVADVTLSLTGDGPIPDGLCALTAKPFSEVLQKVSERLAPRLRGGEARVDPATLQAVLTTVSAPAAVKHLPEYCGAEVRLAMTCDPSGRVAADCLESGLEVLAQSAVASERVASIADVSLLPALAMVAERWAQATVDLRPTSEACGGIARLVALQLSGAKRNNTPPDEQTSAVLTRLAQSLPNIRVADLHGSPDPLLVSVAAAINQRLLLASDQAQRVVEPTPQPPKVMPAPEEPTLVTLKRLVTKLESEFRARGELEEQAAALRRENVELRVERDKAVHSAADFRWQIERLTLQTEQLRQEASSLALQITSARNDAQEWKIECERERVHAAATVRHALAGSSSEITRLVERYGTPAKAIADQPLLSESDLNMLRVNLDNFVQKIERLAARAGGAGSQAAVTGSGNIAQS